MVFERFLTLGFHIMWEQVPLVAGMTVATSLFIMSFPISKPGTYDLLFRRWPRLEIGRIVSKILTTLTATDNEYYVYLAELYKLMSFIN